MKRFHPVCLILITVFGPLFGATAGAALEPNPVREALPKKSETYLREGVISGGDRDVRAGVVKNIRRAINGNFERVVIDLDAEKASYFQAAIEPEQRRILITLFGSPKLGFNAKKVTEDFKKSPLVSHVELFPKIEEDAWTFALHLRAAIPVEVFELTSPTRIILDLKGGEALMSELTPKATVKSAFKVKVKPKAAITAPRRAPIYSPTDSEDEGNGASAHSEDIPE